MVTKREFNRIKRENPESPIGQRDWEEEKTRNDLYKAIMKYKKKWITHPYIEQYKRQLKEKEKLEKEKTKLWDKNTKLQEIILQLEPSHFEKIDLLSWIDDNKLLELQEADLVLIYRDNNTYKDMSFALKDLMEHKYWWIVYCIVIPQDTEELSGNDKELLKNIWKTCNVMTDYTISEWTWIIWDKIPENEYKAEDIQKFLWITEKLEKSFIEKWIDTVYIYVSFIHKDWETWEPKLHYGLLDHWSMCQKENWGIYFFDGEFEDYTTWKEIYTEGEKLQIIEDTKRFWKNQFPNFNVEFIENHDQESWKQYKPDNSVVIADRHSTTRLQPFLWQKIFFAWANFEPGGWIENFVNEEDAQYVWGKGEALAESVLLNLSSFENKIKE